MGGWEEEETRAERRGLILVVKESRLRTSLWGWSTLSHPLKLRMYRYIGRWEGGKEASGSIVQEFLLVYRVCGHLLGGTYVRMNIRPSGGGRRGGAIGGKKPGLESNQGSRSDQYIVHIWRYDGASIS